MMQPKRLIGKTIATVDMRPFSSRGNKRRHNTVAHDPLITFTDGSSISFTVEETEVGVYGVDICLRKPERREA